MLLTGAFQRSLDEKHRFSLPKPVRDALAQAQLSPLFLTPGTDGSLSLYPESVLADLGQQLGQNSPNARDVRTFNRLFYAQAHRVELDRQARVRVPGELVQWAKLERDIVLLGVRDHLELWAKARWDEYLAAHQMQFDQIADEAFRQSESGSAGSTADGSTADGSKSPAETPHVKPR